MEPTNRVKATQLTLEQPGLNCVASHLRGFFQYIHYYVYDLQLVESEDGRVNYGT